MNRGQIIPGWASSTLGAVGKTGPVLIILMGLIFIADEIYKLSLTTEFRKQHFSGHAGSRIGVTQAFCTD